MRKEVVLFLLLIVFVVIATGCSTSEENNQMKLWYDKPAENWMKEALPLGNGYM